MTETELIHFLETTGGAIPRGSIQARLEATSDDMLFVVNGVAQEFGTIHNIENTQIDNFFDYINVDELASLIVDAPDTQNAESGIILSGTIGVPDGVVVSLPTDLVESTLETNGLQLQMSINGGA